MKSSLIKEAAKKDKSEWLVDMYFLRAMKDNKSGEGFIQIYVSHEDTGWLFFDNAVDSEGKEMKFIQISRNVSTDTKYGAGIVEDFAIPLNIDYLDSKSENGILIRVYGKNGNRRIEIPAYYIQGFLEKYKSFIK